MRNFRITQDGHLQKRPGYKTVIDLGAEICGLWTGNVKGAERLLAAVGGRVYALDTDQQSFSELGEVRSGERVSFFGFGGSVYILDGAEYRKWDGDSYTVVEGYRPVVAVAVQPSGGGTELEEVNRLNGLRRCWFSPDGEATVFQLPESGISSVDWVKNRTDGELLPADSYTADTAAGTVTFNEAPPEGTSTLEIAWTASVSQRDDVTAMRFGETYNGTTDNRVFLYGDGTNRAIYSGIAYGGEPTAEYFPELSVLHAGDENTPITGLIRQYSRLIAFKSDSTYSIVYSSLTLADGSVTAGFYVTPVNRNIGNEAPGQVQLITNYPRTLHGGGVYEWKNGSYGLTSDERQAKRISERIESTLSSFDLSKCVTFDNEYRQDYYIVCDGTALVHNYATDAWFIYTDFPAAAFAMADGELYIGTTDGRFCHVSREYMSDDGASISAFWRSGSMDFDREWRRKFSTMIFVTIKPESAGRVTVTARSDRKAEHTERVIAASLTTFAKMNFAHFSFNTNRRSRVERAKIKVKNFALYQLVFHSDSASERCTVESVNFRLRYSGYVK